MTGTDIQAYNSKLEGSQQELANGLCDLISKALPIAEGKVWHGHPVWFIDGNPILGYSLNKAGIEVLFWSGQSFTEPGLRPIGKYKAAGIAIQSTDDVVALAKRMQEALSVQWDYKNLPKLRKLEKLTDF
jgi:hypothetical protein